MQQGAILEYALDQAEPYYAAIDELAEQAYAGNASAWLKILETLALIEQIEAESTIATRLVGMLAPWCPALQENPNHALPANRIDLANMGRTMLVRLRIAELDRLMRDNPAPHPSLIAEKRELELELLEAGQVIASPPTKQPLIQAVAQHPLFQRDYTAGLPGTIKTRYPALENGVRFLREKKVVTDADLKSLTIAEQQKVFSARGVQNVRTLTRLKNAVADSHKTGEDLRAFRERIGKFSKLDKSESETLFRTHNKQAYVEGMDAVLAKPEVEDAFGYVMYIATSDPRVRSHHWDMDRFVCSRKDPAFKLIKFLLGEWNCRCSMIPLSKKRAEGFGIMTIKDVPSSVVAHAIAAGLAL